MSMNELNTSYYYQQSVKPTLHSNYMLPAKMMYPDEFNHYACDDTYAWMGESMIDWDQSYQEAVKTIEHIKSNNQAPVVSVQVSQFIEYKGSRKRGWRRKGSLSKETSTINEARRQIHIRSEQKRRTQIKNGFDELQTYLPGCQNKKLSKAVLLSRTVQQLKHMQKIQDDLITEVEKLLKENSMLRQKLIMTL